ncbi:hypothetical protein D2A34_22410 [Clostridium chromiireducens]|uniref:Uncharacterized protein n=1 Tax=Clostridium chromiireducens TaxID=225345 RepID=A0A399IHJ5_9CLOT|nr:hypothetical protein [Clostridium chromiireducens]RII32435.1 hypothetical protein D2A34_22410 [Clostridium chromiireducens]
MKKYLIGLFLFITVIMNIYLVFYWEPQGQMSAKKEDVETVVSYTKSIYKVNKGKILEQLSPENKKELEQIMKKLSALDMGRIKEYYEEPDEEKGVINAFKLLKKRLSSEDYNKLEQLSSSFLDIKRINEKIKK